MDVSKIRIPQPLVNLGLVGERKALALLGLGFFTALFGLLTLVSWLQMPEWIPCFLAMTACYGVAFFALAADWFWARWFSVGLGYSGLTMGLLAMVTTRDFGLPMILFGGVHGLVALLLLGPRMVERYEGNPTWRDRWKVDEPAARKVRQTVTRAASSLPTLILFALAPRNGGEALVALAAVGMFGLLRGKTWGVLALAAAGVATASSLLLGVSWHGLGIPAGHEIFFSLSGTVAAAALLLAAAPFLPSIARRICAR